MDNNTQILKNVNFLKNYEINNISENVVQKILSISNLPNVNGKNQISRIIAFLNCYYSLQNKHLSYIDLSSKETYNQFSKFTKFLNVEYIDSGEDSLCRCRKKFIKIVEVLSEEHNNLKEIKQLTLNVDKFDEEKINYYKGWHIVNPKNKKSYFLNLIKLNKIFNSKELTLIKESSELFITLRSDGQMKSNLSVLKTFNSFLVDNIKSKKDLCSEDKSKKIIYKFCKEYFEEGQRLNYCLDSRMRYWNEFKYFFDFLFIRTGMISFDIDEYPIAPKKSKKSFLTNIKNNNGIQYKKKLLTDIPLSIDDNEAIELLFSKIINDVDIVNRWCEDGLSSFEDQFNNPVKELNAEDFNLDSKQIRAKYKFKINQNDFLIKCGVPSHAILEYFMFSLINEHPEITDSFLINFKLYSPNGELIGIDKTDSGMYLSGNKLRRGSKLAEQKILLNKKSEHLIDLLIKCTTSMREYLKTKDGHKWCNLFIGFNDGLEPKVKTKTIVPAPSNMKMLELQKRIEYFSEIKSIKNPINFVSNLTLTKFRASKGVQTYLKTESTNEMSKVLGHDKYRPELLSRYLPEVILNFFQSRWIRIFQKGIICEALKDSEYLYKASSFSSMDELDSFIKKHSIIEKEPIKSDNLDVKCDELFISINEEILTSLLSLQRSVEESVLPINPKAVYWSEFSKRLTYQIEKENKNITFLPILKQAKKKINPNLFKDVINA